MRARGRRQDQPQALLRGEKAHLERALAAARAERGRGALAARRRRPRPGYVRGAARAPAPPSRALPAWSPARPRACSRPDRHPRRDGRDVGRHPHRGDRRRRADARAHPSPADHRPRDRRRSRALPRSGGRRHSPARSQRRWLEHAGDRALRRGHRATAIRASCDCIIQPSTGGAVGMSIDERAGPLACRPEMATLNCGSINFGDDVFINSPVPSIRRLALRIQEAADAVPELECYEVGHIAEALALSAEGVLRGPLHFQFVLGVKGAIPAREDVVGWRRSMVPSGSTWGVAAIGRSQQPLTELAMRLGGHARVGLEDNVYLKKDVLSEGSAPLVARAGGVRAIDRAPAGGARPRPRASRAHPRRLDGALRRSRPPPRSRRETISSHGRHSHVRRRHDHAGARLRRAPARGRRRRFVLARERRRGRAVGTLFDPGLSAASRDDAAGERTVGRRARRGGSRPGERPRPARSRARPLRAVAGSGRGRRPGRALRARLRRLSRVGSRPRDREGPGLGRDGHGASRAVLRRIDHRRLRQPLAHGHDRGRRRGRRRAHASPPR